MNPPHANLGRRLASLSIAVVVCGSFGAAAFAAEITGTPGDDDLTGTASADTVWALGGDDTVHGGGGNDVLHGGPGADTIAGDAGRDALRGDSGADGLSGNAGPDTIYTYRSDVAHGGGDADLIRVGHGEADAYGDAGLDRLIAWGVGTSVLYGGPERDELVVESNGSGKVLYGGPGDDSLFTLVDGATMNGGSGADTLVMRFAGVLVGADGDDTLVGDSVLSPSETTLRCGPGTDRVSADLADEIGADCEDVTVNIQGDDGDNAIVGTAYNDSIDSGEGNDDVQGLGGSDGITLRGGEDSVDAGDGDDTVYAHWGSLFQIVGDVDDVACGAGSDTAMVDDVDTVSSDCETVFVSVAPKS